MGGAKLDLARGPSRAVVNPDNFGPSLGSCFHASWERAAEGTAREDVMKLGFTSMNP